MIHINGTIYFILILITALAYGVTGLSVALNDKKDWFTTSVSCFVVGIFWPVTLPIWGVLGILTGFKKMME